MKTLTLILLIAFTSRADQLLSTQYKGNVSNLVQIVINDSTCNPCAVYWNDGRTGGGDYGIFAFNITGTPGDTINRYYNFPGYASDTNHLYTFNNHKSLRSSFTITVATPIPESIANHRIGFTPAKQNRHMVNGREIYFRSALLFP